MNATAYFSSDRKYRYTLWRTWGERLSVGYAMFIGLNPSTADERTDDPTVRRCVGYAKDLGYAGLCMTNLFAFRATKPADMKSEADPIGRENDYQIKRAAKEAGIIIAAWGNHGIYMARGDKVREMIGQPLHVLKLTNSEIPAHPLYLPRSLKPKLWSRGRSCEL